MIFLNSFYNKIYNSTFKKSGAKFCIYFVIIFLFASHNFFKSGFSSFAPLFLKVEKVDLKFHFVIISC